MQFSSDFELPDGVTSIGDGAFLGCALTEIHIKETVLTVNSGAFDSPSLKNNS